MGYTIEIPDGRLEELSVFSAKLIDVVFSYYETITRYFQVLGFQKAYPAFANNFKDSFMHFKKIEECRQLVLTSKDQKVVADNCIMEIVQFELLLEHLTRGIMDILVELLQNMRLLLYTEVEAIRYYYPDCDDCREYAVKAHPYLAAVKTKLMAIRTSKMDIARIAYQNLTGIDYDPAVTKRLADTLRIVEDTACFITENWECKRLKALYMGMMELINGRAEQTSPPLLPTEREGHRPD